MMLLSFVVKAHHSVAAFLPQMGHGGRIIAISSRVGPFTMSGR
jgi:hypothetical protein